MTGQNNIVPNDQRDQDGQMRENRKKIKKEIHFIVEFLN